MKRTDKMTLGQKVMIIKEEIPTFTLEKAMECTLIEFENLFEKVIDFKAAKKDLELMIICQGY